MVDRLLHDDLRKIYLHLKAPRFDLHRPTGTVTVSSALHMMRCQVGTLVSVICLSEREVSIGNAPLFIAQSILSISSKP
jgi:hypothetical protein